MILNAVIVKNKKSQINEILRTGFFYATTPQEDNKSHKISFYKNEEIARKKYPKEIKGILHISIDTDNMEFFDDKKMRVLLKPIFSETDSEYVFSFDESIKDLHYKINPVNNSF